MTCDFLWSIDDVNIFLIEMLATTEKPALLQEKTQVFEKKNSQKNMVINITWKEMLVI